MKMAKRRKGGGGAGHSATYQYLTPLSYCYSVIWCLMMLIFLLFGVGRISKDQ